MNTTTLRLENVTQTQIDTEINIDAGTPERLEEGRTGDSRSSGVSQTTNQNRGRAVPYSSEAEMRERISEKIQDLREARKKNTPYHQIQFIEAELMECSDLCRMAIKRYAQKISRYATLMDDIDEELHPFEPEDKPHRNPNLCLDCGQIPPNEECELSCAIMREQIRKIDASKPYNIHPQSKATRPGAASALTASIAPTVGHIGPETVATILPFPTPKLRLSNGQMTNVASHRTSSAKRGMFDFLNPVKDLVDSGSNFLGKIPFINPTGGMDQNYTESTAETGQLEASETIDTAVEHVEMRSGAVVDTYSVENRTRQHQTGEEVMPEIEFNYHQVAAIPAYVSSLGGEFSGTDLPFSVIKVYKIQDLLKNADHIRKAMGSWSLVAWDSVRVEISLSTPRISKGMYFASFVPGSYAENITNSSITRLLTSNRANINIAYQTAVSLDCPYVSETPAQATKYLFDNSTYGALGAVAIGCIDPIEGPDGEAPTASFRIKVAVQGLRMAYHQPAENDIPSFTDVQPQMDKRFPLPPTTSNWELAGRSVPKVVETTQTYKEIAETLYWKVDKADTDFKEWQTQLNSWESDVEGRKRALAFSGELKVGNIGKIKIAANNLWTYYRDKPKAEDPEVSALTKMLNELSPEKVKLMRQILFDIKPEMDEPVPVVENDSVLLFPKTNIFNSYQNATIMGQRSHIGREPNTASPSAVDEMDVTSIISRFGPRQLSLLTWNTSHNPGTSLINMPVHPITGNGVYNPLRIVSDMAEYWRGSIRYRFHVIANSFYSGSLAIGLSPVYAIQNPAANPGAYPHVIVDIRDKASFTVRVGYFGDTIVKRTGKTQETLHPQSMIGQNMNISVMNRLTTTGGNPGSISIFVEVCGYEGDENGNGKFQLFNVHTDNSYNRITPTRIPFVPPTNAEIGLHAQGAGMKTGTMDHDEEPDFLVGYDLPALNDPPQQLEPFTHLLQLLERMSPLFPQSSPSANMGLVLRNAPIDWVPVGNAYYPKFAIIRNMFAMWNGSMQVMWEFKDVEEEGAYFYRPTYTVDPYDIYVDNGVPRTYLPQIAGVKTFDLPFITEKNALFTYEKDTDQQQRGYAGMFSYVRPRERPTNDIRVSRGIRAGANFSFFYWAGIPPFNSVIESQDQYDDDVVEPVAETLPIDCEDGINQRLLKTLNGVRITEKVEAQMFPFFRKSDDYTDNSQHYANAEGAPIAHTEKPCCSKNVETTTIPLSDDEEGSDEDEPPSKGVFSDAKAAFKSVREAATVLNKKVMKKTMKNANYTFGRVQTSLDGFDELVTQTRNIIENLGLNICERAFVIIIDLLECLYFKKIVKWIGFVVKTATLLGFTGAALTAFKNAIHPILSKLYRAKEQEERLEPQAMSMNALTGILAIAIVGAGVLLLGGERWPKRSETLWEFLSEKGRELSNIVRGASGLKQSVKFISEQLQEWIIYLFGDHISEEAMPTHYVILKKAKEIFKSMEYVMSFKTRKQAILNPVIPPLLNKIYLYKSELIGHWMAEKDRDVRQKYEKIGHTIGQFLKEFAPVDPSVITRPHPFEISLFGETRIGKSALSMALCKAINISQEQEAHSIYQINDTLDHFDGYAGQYSCQIDDKDAILDAESAKNHITRMSNVPYILPMADLSEKGTYFNSLFVASSTNTAYPKITGLAEVKAYHRRRDILVHVEKRSATQENDFSNLKFTRMNNVENIKIDNEPLDIYKFLEKALVDFSVHLKKQFAMVSRIDGSIPLHEIVDYSTLSAEELSRVTRKIWEQALKESHGAVKVLTANEKYERFLSEHLPHYDISRVANRFEVREKRLNSIDNIDVGSVEAEMWKFAEAISTLSPLNGNTRVNELLEDLQDAHGLLQTAQDKVTRRLPPLMQIQHEIWGIARTASSIGFRGLQLLLAESTKMIWNEVRKLERPLIRGLHLIMPFLKFFALIVAVMLFIWSIKLIFTKLFSFFGDGEEEEQSERKKYPPGTEEHHCEAHDESDCSDCGEDEEGLKARLESLKNRKSQPTAPESGYSKDGYKAKTPKMTLRKGKPGKVKNVKAQASNDKNHKTILETLEPNVWTIRTRRGVTNCIALGGTWFLVPRHVLDIDEDYIKVDLQRFNVNYTGIIERRTKIRVPRTYEMPDEKNDIHMAKMDYCFADLAATGVQSSKKIVKHFATEDEIAIATNSSATLLTRDNETQHIREKYADRVKVVSEMCYSINEKTSEEEWYGMLRGWSYKMATARGNCGAPLVADNPALMGKIIGIHTAGCTKRGVGHGMSIVMVRGFILEAVPELDKPMFEGNGMTMDEGIHAEYQEMQGIKPTGNQIYLGRLVKEEATYQMTKTDLAPSVIHDVLFKHTKEPAVLSDKDPRFDPSYPTPRARGMDKFGKESVPIHPSAIRRAKNVLIRRMVKILQGKSTDMLTVDQVLNGDKELGINPMNMRTSPGYPYMKMKESGKLGKLSFVENLGTEMAPHYQLTPFMQSEVLKVLDTYKNGGETYNNFYVDCLKDELRGLDKIKIGKTRTFNNGNMAQLIVRKMLFGKLIAAYQQASLEMCHMIGQDTFGADTTVNEQYLDEVNNYLRIGYDVEHWDSAAMRKIIVTSSWDILAESAFILDKDRELLETRKRNGQAAVQRIHINGDIVYEANDGEASGDEATIHINSLGHLLIAIMVFCILASLYDPAKNDPELFFTYVRAIYGGDDGKETCHPEIKSWYNPMNLKHGWKIATGCNLTDPDKKSEMQWYTKETASFLKQRSRRDPRNNNRYFSMIDEETIRELFNWIRPSSFEEPEETLDVHVRDAFRFAFHYGPEYYNKLQEDFNNLAITHGLQVFTESWEDKYEEWCKLFD